MSYDLTNDADGVAGPSLPGISARHLRQLTRWALVFIGLILLFLLMHWLVGVFTDLLWFGHLGRLDVFSKIIGYRITLFLTGTLIATAVLLWNLHLTLRHSRGTILLSQPRNVIRLLVAGAVAVSALTLIIAGPAFGAAAAARWEVFLLLFNRVSFGFADPQFGLDASFYVVTLGVLNFVQGWLLGLAITAIAVSLACYVAIFSIRGVALVITPRMFSHIAALGVFLMLVIAANHLLDIYELVISEGGVVFGATYADIHARFPLNGFLAGVAVLAAAGIWLSTRYAGLRLMIAAFSLWAILALVTGLAFPALFQRFEVDPDEFNRERLYILRNLTATRAAYQLDQVRRIDYPATGTLDWRAVQENRATLDNIRIWDQQPLRDAYNQLQFMELYYSFLNVDSDRYIVDGRLRQVLISARELDAGNLPADARNWVNQRLQYTHGYGVAMSPATGFTPGEGRPEYFLRDIPIQGQLLVSRPELYYGEATGTFAIVNSNLREVNPDPEFQRYDGTGGIPLSSLPRRIAYAWRLADINILLSEQVTPESRIQYRRSIQDRVSRLAPFLKLDSDPYPVVDGSGKLWWILDAYTITRRYPYATPANEEFNYIRNSVKVTVDAYNGAVNFYTIDPADPLLGMYRRAFPHLFQDLSAMPPALREHIRYPLDLFTAQARMFLRYHVTDAQVFFNQSEQWDIPLETSVGKTGVGLKPSYLMLRLPEEEKEEFALLLPFTPAGNKKNLVGWLIARSDGANYGQLLSFQLPKDRQFDGPSQVEARIENDPVVSQQFTLWNGSGSRIIRGQLLVIPVADTILYVEPLYLQSEVLAFPELKKVILADESRLVMADTVDEALALLTGADSEFFDFTSGEALDLGEVQAAIDQLREALGSLEQSLENLSQPEGGSGP